MSGARKRGLGRGLDALLSGKPPAKTHEQSAADLEGNATTATSHRVAIDLLEANRHQPRTRFADGDLEELAASIREQGVIQPIVVTPTDEGRYTIVAGERRWRAAARAGLKEVPVVVRQVAGEQELLELALVENLQRSDLDPLEEAEAYESLRARFGLSQADIAKKVGKGRSTVTNSLRLLRLPEEVQELVRGGQLTAGQVRPLLGLSPARQIELAHRAIQQDLSARDLEALSADGVPAKKKTAGKKTKADVHTAAAAERLTRALQTRVEIRRRGERGQVCVHFHSEEELMRLYERFVQAEG